MYVRFQSHRLKVRDEGLTMNTTSMVVYIGILTLAIYDLTVVVFKGTASSVSQFLITTAFKSPPVSIAFGVTIGHLWGVMWPMEAEMDWKKRMVIAGCGAVLGSITTIVVQQIAGRRECHL